MAMVMDQQQQPQAYKHYCRVCKKGFGCGRALGGHMRAHGINDEPAGGPDGDSASSGCSGWGDEDKQRQPPSHRRMYALRANPARLIKSCRSCENCGREFASWKSFLEHGKCSSDDGEEEEDDDDDAYHYGSFASSPRSDADDDGLIRHGGWSKGKRSRRTKSSSAVPVSICPSNEEEEDLANFLVMLSSARVDRPVIIVEPEESCASASKEDDRRHHPTPAADKSKGTTAAAPAARPRGMFECKACKKVFSCHQALGGHRASHKKVKGCFAAKLEEAPAQEDAINQDDPNQEAAAAMAMAIAIVPSDDTPPLKKKPKVHECSICQRQFSSGQALGGHKRCHWITTNSPDPTPVAKLQKVQQQDPTNNRRHHHHHHHHHHQELTLRPMFDPSETIDLNMPVAPADVLIALRQDIGGSPLRLDVPAAIYIQPWVYQDRKKKATASSNDNNYNSEGACSMNVDDEVDSKVKLAKLSELKDMNAGGEASPWLQVGIGSSGNEASTEK